jgi:hypothetical protein
MFLGRKLLRCCVEVNREGLQVGTSTYEAEECRELFRCQFNLKRQPSFGTHGLLLRQITGSAQDHYDGVVFELFVAAKIRVSAYVALLL